MIPYGITYLTQNQANGKIYIGQTIKDNPDYLGSGVQIVNAVKKYGKENFKRETLETCYSRKELDESEIYWIDFFGFPNNDSLYNVVAGGGSISGYTFSEETKNKISNSLKGKYKKEDHPNYGSKRGEETKKKLSAALRLRKDSDETKRKKAEAIRGRKNPMHLKSSKEKISKALKGRKFSDETKEKMSIAASKRMTEEARNKLSNNRKDSKAVIVYKDGEFFCEFNSISRCARELNLNKASVRFNLRKGTQFRGFLFKLG